MIYDRTVRVPPLVSGGVMLTYRCTNACRHCLYRCSPRLPNEWITMETCRRAFDALQHEPSLQSIHLAGGEATLNMERLLDVIRLATDMEMPVAYLETNASWCVDPGDTLKTMEVLREAGLPALLVSASMFHNEFVSFRAMRTCVETARCVFGEENVIVYMPYLYELLSRMPDDGIHTLDAFCNWAGISDSRKLIPRLYDVIPSGRAVEALRECYETHTANAYVGENCSRELSDTTHFHIDYNGDLFTGLCPGIAPGTIDYLHPAITADSHPVFWQLWHFGPRGLMQMAVDDCDFKPSERGYISKCDLCYDVRRSLHRKGDFLELRPALFYEEAEETGPGLRAAAR